MNSDTVDFQLVSGFDAEALGEPGQRTFRLRVRREADTASLWVEKQQLAALCLALRQVLNRLPALSPSALPSVPMSYFPLTAGVEFRVGRLALGWDEAGQRFTITAEPLEGGGAPSRFQCEVDVSQAIAFCDLGEAIYASGRAICPLCYEPMDPAGHNCVRGNGHFEGREIPEADDEDEEE